MEPQKDLATAFALAQIQFPVIPPNRKNNRGYYADITQMRTIIDPILNKHGLSLRQHIDTLDNGNVVLRSILSHASGQKEESCMPIIIDDNKGMSKNQIFGSGVSYAARYEYRFILGLRISNDPDDDDGDRDPMISRDQHAHLESILEGKAEIKKAILNYNKVTSLTELTSSQYQSIVDRLLKKN